MSVADSSCLTWRREWCRTLPVYLGTERGSQPISRPLVPWFHHPFCNIVSLSYRCLSSSISLDTERYKGPLAPLAPFLYCPSCSKLVLP